LNDTFTVEYKIFNNYLSNTEYESNGFTVDVYNTELQNTNDNFKCDAFYLETNPDIFVNSTLDLRIDQPSTGTGFENITGLFCNNGTKCEPDIVIEEMIDSGKIGTQSAVDNNEADETT